MPDPARSRFPVENIVFVDDEPTTDVGDAVEHARRILAEHEASEDAE
jgi:hypothetical protein